MSYIVEQIDDAQYELFTTEEATTPEGQTVQIKTSVGIYTVAELQAKKESYQASISSMNERIADIDAKLAAIA